MPGATHVELEQLARGDRSPRLAHVKARHLLAITAIPALLSLAACGPGQSDPVPASGSPGASATATPAPSAEPLPADALMLVTATATASTGAQLALRLIVHEPGAWDAAAGADGAAATIAWCAGEVDADVIATAATSFTRIEVDAEQLGELTWPADERIRLDPTPEYTTLAATGNVAQVPSPLPQPGDYVPHCKQTAMLTGAGEGDVFSGAEQDAAGRDGLPPLHFWSRLTFGFSNDPDASPTIGFTDCAVEITPLGESFGAPGAGWHEDFLAASCIVGGTTGY